MDDNLSPTRRAGLLAPVFALRHDDDLGIGDTLAVRNAADFCARNGFTILQILPIHDTVGDHSPYNPISSRALSPTLLHLDPASIPGLSLAHIHQVAPADVLSELRGDIVRHDIVHTLKLEVLRESARCFFAEPEVWPEEHEDLRGFQHREAAWLEPYLLFRVLLEIYDDQADWRKWRAEHRSPATAHEAILGSADREMFEERMRTNAYIQWLADRQWRGVKAHCETLGVQLMGELSYGVGFSSADVWAHPELFHLDWCVGTPPLAAFDTTPESERWGQNWGFPAYNWNAHRAAGHAWLRSRVLHERRYFHILRIDHLRGYFRAYLFPWHGGGTHSHFAKLSAEQAASLSGGRLPRFLPGPDDDPDAARENDLLGREIIQTIQSAAGDMELIAELMGDFPDYMRKALQDLDLPNLTFPQLEESGNEHFRKRSLIAYANHDNAPLAVLYPQLLAESRRDSSSPSATKLRRLLDFIGCSCDEPEDFDEELLSRFHNAIVDSPCEFAVLMISDLFGLPLRFNLPGSHGNETWCARLPSTLEKLEKHPQSAQLLHNLRHRLLQESPDPLPPVGA